MSLKKLSIISLLIILCAHSVTHPAAGLLGLNEKQMEAAGRGLASGFFETTDTKGVDAAAAMGAAFGSGAGGGAGKYLVEEFSGGLAQHTAPQGNLHQATENLQHLVNDTFIRPVVREIRADVAPGGEIHGVLADTTNMLDAELGTGMNRLTDTTNRGLTGARTMLRDQVRAGAHEITAEFAAGGATYQAAETVVDLGEREAMRIRNIIENSALSLWNELWAIGTGYLILGAGGTIAAIYGTKVFFNHLERRLQRPTLFLNSSSGFIHSLRLWWKNKQPKTQMALPDYLKVKLENIVKTTNIIRFKIKAGVKNVKYRNLLLYGPPGTGKTMFAKELARRSGMEFAIISASILFSLPTEQALKEIDDLYIWGKKNKRVLVVLDEVDVLLSKRTNLSPDSKEYKIISHLLAITGEQTDIWMLVGTTNYKNALDPAVLDRFDDKIEMPLPDLNYRIKVLTTHIRKILFNTKYNESVLVNSAKNLLTDTYITMLAHQTEGLSNRKLHKIINKIISNTHATRQGEVTDAIVTNVVNETIQEQQITNAAAASAA